ncbi:MAG: DUF2309 domain-containing protein [Pseudohongiellaceae bacterium]|nr:DUF2309 domain-containing protein [Pseudohongiellaceae bacterium]
MNAALAQTQETPGKLQAAIQAACQTIAPTWPLDRMIAVNPYWERKEHSFANVGETLDKIAGSSLTMPLCYYKERYVQGDIQLSHLEKAISDKQSSLTAKQLLDALEEKSPSSVPAPLLCDAIDRERNLHHEPAWCDTITHQVAQFCAAYFDRDQADWRPNQEQTLYASWRQALTQDHSVSLLMKAPGIPTKAKTLASDPEQQISLALEQLGVEASQWDMYLQTVLMRVSGWASWCAYRRWQARLEAKSDNTLVDLLAIRLSWECLIDDGERYKGSPWNRWQEAWQEHFQKPDNTALQSALLWQRAHEISYQEQLFGKLCHTCDPAQATSDTPDVQAVFCIDVRSEVFRRHLEAQSSGIQTLGFAGFFGLPISYTPVGTEATRPQLPGLLAPALNITESTGNAASDEKAIEQRQKTLKNRFSWRPFQSAPASSFTLVEALGLAYAGKLIKRSLPNIATAESPDALGLNKQQAHSLRPTVKNALLGDVTEQAKIAAQVLTAMGLSSGLAPLVLLIGHGSQTQNNPQRAGLDCGACCGQTGEVNSRALASLLNDPAVRQQLVTDGIDVPATTHFVAGLHNTTTDEVTLFDTDILPTSHDAPLQQIIGQLNAAGLAARQERAPLLGLGKLVSKPAKLTKAVKQRANDWAQTRPEWGLANNAAFIVAPRARTRGVNLAGRSFLHDYDYKKDPEGKLLELIMTAPMVVTNWINMQYHASTVDNRRYGSGNKTLHNVVGGRLGMFEGNGGDLRIGLALQSVHDGEQWRHDPLRLTVLIDAPRAAIERVIATHETVRNLVHNQWLYLARFDGAGIESYQQGSWQAWEQSPQT